MPLASSLVPGDVLAGRYEILREVGKGGMGRVYEAFDRALKERVAVKVLLQPAPDDEARGRFLSEVKLARRIRHRNVVALHEYGEEGGLPYFSMEFVEGEDLRHVIHARSALDWDTAYALAEQIGHGLQAAHEMGVVHRDLKPANLMIQPSGDVRIMDFGVAKGGGEPGATQAGVAIGTPEYMSPEQVQAREVDPRSDLYAFGIVLFEMFTGRVPFTGPSALATMVMQVEQPAPLDPPDTLIPGSLVPVLRKALAKSPDERYATCAEMLQALVWARRQQGTDPLPVLSRGDSGREATVMVSPQAAVLLPSTAVPPEARLLLPMLVRALDSPQAEVQLGAIHALQLHGPAAEAAIPRLETLRADPAVGQAATDALKAIAPTWPSEEPSPLPSSPVPTSTVLLPGPKSGNAERAGPAAPIDPRAAATAPELATPVPPAPPPVSPSPPIDPSPRPARGSEDQDTQLPPPVVRPPQPRNEPKPVVVAPAPRPGREPEGRSGGSKTPNSRAWLVALGAALAVLLLVAYYWRQPPAPPEPRLTPEPTTTTLVPPPTTQGPIVVSSTTSTTLGVVAPAVTIARPVPTTSSTTIAPSTTTSTSTTTTTSSTTTTTVPTTTTTVPTTTTTTTLPPIQPPVCAQCPGVPYPEIAKDPRVNAQGSVDLRLLVDEQGGVTVVSATYRPLPSRRAADRQGQKILESAAADWVKKKWRYRPARRGGVPMRMEVTQPVEFVLGE